MSSPLTKSKSIPMISSAGTLAAKNKLVAFVPAPQDFVAAFYAHLPPSDMAQFSADERLRIAASIWALATSRRPAETKIRVYNPSPETEGWTVDHTVIEIINDDTPFLVDSVVSVLQSRGLTVHVVIHPVLRMHRDAKGKIAGIVAGDAKDSVAECFMHIEVDHCLDEILLQSIENDMRMTLRDVRCAVEDWRKMRNCINEVIEHGIVARPQTPPGEDVEEVRAFLNWLNDDNFTFLGYRDVDLKQEGENITAIKIVPGSGLGILRDDEARMFGGLRDFDKRQNAQLRKYVRQNHLLFVTKTNAVTRVHRSVPMDAVFVRRFGADGAVVGERLFVGLFTSKTYAQTPHEIPLIRSKIADVTARIGYAPKSHDGRSLMHVLNTYPHDELFQISEDELYTNTMGILQLQERARIALFLRRDPFGRYVTCLIYVPRDRYDSSLRVRIQDFLEHAYAGRAQGWNVRIDGSHLARAFVTIHLTPDSPHPDAATLEANLREMCRSWADHLRDYMVKAYGEAAALALLRRYGDAFPEPYRDVISPARAVQDVSNLEKMRISPRFIADLEQIDDTRVSLKLFQPDRPLSLSEALPLIENMGLRIDYMGGPYEIRLKDDAVRVFIHEFVGHTAQPSLATFERVKPVFEEALAKVWSGEVENDPFNALTLRVGLGWNAVVMLRAFARYLRQLRIPYSHDMIATTLLAYPQVAQQLFALFFARHNPKLDAKARMTETAKIEAAIIKALSGISTLEDDRIIRRYLNLVQASLRTNYFQISESGQPKAYLSIKFDSRAVDYMPLPKPLYEIFVYSPQTEAVHLRGGKVARGGIRWSDRREDFRNEILGLMKAQMVKNSVIVPVGSKGGFIVKRPPAEADKIQAEGIACYTILMRGMLDITDNAKGGKIIPPANVVRHDGDDPYLVVAADKGTATFSDIANGLAQSYGYWLDDAFASGGSAGYDHKSMGITARGAWEAVKRHFREMGKDIQTQDFTCIGVGDMSGDVFGNGMLLSKHTRLLGAFDHRHIFCDPNPDAAQSYGERKRLFALPRSSWSDYDRKLISKGGGVFARTEKAIKLSPEMKKVYGVAADSLAPSDLITAMLKADVELLYFGGIGTYVKAFDESHDEVADRANDAIRINGADLRAKVAGEGANLGMTQRGRIEFAQRGGRLNTDAIDNSAGVDTSDHEVNIKILLRKAVDRNKLTLAARNKLLGSMTDEVGQLVLRDNYLQTQALSLSEAQAPELLSAHVRCMQLLEKSGLLNRVIEFMPDDAEIAERQRLGKGLTRPELAVLLAYAKIQVYQKILDSDLPDDPALKRDVADYFPKALRSAYAADIHQHQLRREIAATVVTNDIVNHVGARVLLTMSEQGDVAAVTRAYLLARDAFALPEIWAEIEAQDNKIHASTQTRMLTVVHSALTAAMRRLLQESAVEGDLSAAVEANRKGLAQLSECLVKNPAIIDVHTHRLEMDWRAEGVPEDLACRAALVPVLVSAFGLTELAAKTKLRMSDLAAIFFGFEKRLNISWLGRLATVATAQTPWQREAASVALEELAANHRRLTAQLAMKQVKSKAGGKEQSLDSWVAAHHVALDRYDAMLAEWHAAGVVDLAMLLLANERLHALSA